MDKNCTIYRTTNFIGKRWTILIMLELYKGKTGVKRYSELKKKLPDITPKILSLRLKELEKLGLVNKKVDTNVMPIKCEYSLTESGSAFIKVIRDLKKWALEWDVGSKNCGDSDCKICEL